MGSRLQRSSGMILAGLALALAGTAAPAWAAEPAKAAAGQLVQIPFVPPIGEPVRYRWEKTVERDGASRTSWEVFELGFEEMPEGYKLTVTTRDGGSGEQDEAGAARQRRFLELTARPFVALISNEGVIQGIEDEEQYWAGVFAAIDAQAQGAEATADPDLADLLTRFADTYRDMPVEARRVVLLEPIRPLFDFVETQSTVGKPIRMAARPGAEGAEPAGETIATLVEATGDLARLSVVTTVPRQAAGAAGGAGTPSLESRADYRISTETGRLKDYVSTERVEAGEGDAIERRTTTRKLAQR